MVFKKVKLFVLKKVIEYTINNIKEHCIIFIGSKIGISHLGISILLLIL